jgi:hypothetical protein
VVLLGGIIMIAGACNDGDAVEEKKEIKNKKIIERS